MAVARQCCVGDSPWPVVLRVLPGGVALCGLVVLSSCSDYMCNCRVARLLCVMVAGSARAFVECAVGLVWC